MTPMPMSKKNAKEVLRPFRAFPIYASQTGGYLGVLVHDVYLSYRRSQLNYRYIYLYFYYVFIEHIFFLKNFLD
jgi:hypothetical protein